MTKTVKFEAGTKIKSKEDNRIFGTITKAIKWNSDNYQGFVYEFKRDGRTFFGYKEDELELNI